MPDNSFFARTEQLEKMVGKGNLVGIFAVDGGPRTVPLEVGGWKTGPNAGVQIENWTEPNTGPHAAKQSFEAAYPRSLEDIAKTTLETGPQGAMERHVEKVQEEFEQKAPKRDGSYRQSTARFVTDNGQLAYQRYGASYGGESS